MKFWIYRDNAQQGPYTLDELRQMNVSADTKVWHAGLPKWYPAGMLPELASLLEDAAQQQESATAESSDADTTAVQASDGASEQNIGVTSDTASETSSDTTTTDDDAGTTTLDGGERQIAVPEFHAAPEPPPVPVMPPAAPPIPTMRYAAPRCPEAYIVWSVVLLVLCCTPIALVSLITGIMTISSHNAGRYASAQKYSEATAWLIMIAIALGAIPNIILSVLLL